MLPVQSSRVSINIKLPAVVQDVMEIQVLFIQIAAILLAARICGEIALRLKAPPIIGELCAGIILGPSLIGWIAPNEVLNFLAEIGIILLLFEVGLGTDIERLIKAVPRPWLWQSLDL